jgi:hypothetical protein
MTTATTKTTTATNKAFTATVKADQSRALNLWTLGEAIAQEISEAVANGAKAYGYTQKTIVPRLVELSGFSAGYAQKKTSLATSMRAKFDTAQLAVEASTIVVPKAEKPEVKFNATKVVEGLEKKFTTKQLKAILAKLEEAIA